MRRSIAFTLVFCLVAGPLLAGTVTVPAGTTVYCHLDEQVTSRKKETDVGDIVRATVWRDVVVDGAVVIEAGTPVHAHVSKRRSAKIAGVQGKLEIAADTVTLVNGTEVRLEGGYDKRGRGRKALSITLAAVVLWPLIFIKGKQAVLEEGTIFDSYTLYEAKVDLEGHEGPRRVVKLQAVDFIEVEVLYDELERDPKTKHLPMNITACGWDEEPPPMRIDVLNGKEISPALALTLSEAAGDVDCVNVRATADLKALGKMFQKGLNTFEVAADLDGQRISTEVLLEIEF